MLDFKSIYVHQDGYDVDVYNVDYNRYPGFVYAQETVYIEENLVSDVESVYTLDGIFITNSTATMDELVSIGACEYEGVMCPRLAVIARVADSDAYVTWSKGYLKTFDIGYMPTYRDLENYLPTSLSDAFAALATVDIPVDNFAIAPVNLEGTMMYGVFTLKSMNKPLYTLCDMHSRFGVPKYEAVTREDCKQWAIESTFALKPELVGRFDE